MERFNDKTWESILGESSDQQPLTTNTGVLGLAPRHVREKHQMAGTSR